MVVPSSSRQEEVLKLIADKDALELRISEHGRVLELNGIGMTESLVDADGFPRNDIDVHQIRNARHQIICLQNDLKSLLKQIEAGLHAVHAEAKTTSGGSDSAKMRNLVMDDSSAPSNSGGGGAATGSEPMDQQPVLMPIVLVNLVSPSSPAELAGLELNDKIVEFGSVNSNNFTGLNQIADIVRHRQNQTIILKVQRDGSERLLNMRLVPKPWTGRGLLGCNIVLCNSP